MKTTLIIMAAGIGSRFGGGIKQLAKMGPNGEIIMDYSIYDAKEAGFDKVVFIIRKDIEEEFKEVIGNRIQNYMDVEYVFQDIHDLPEGFTCPEGRTKPWGTGQAVLCAKSVVDTPYVIINADDYYGKEAFARVHEYLVSQESGEKGSYSACMAGFVLKNTLSDHGGVTRGICVLDENSELRGVLETKNIIKTPEGAAVKDEAGLLTPINANQLVSMNMWGYTPDFFEELENGFVHFLSEITPETALKAEYLLPTIMDQLLKEDRAQITVLKTRDKWFGVTYKEDVPSVIADFKELLEKGVYPSRLWD